MADCYVFFSCLFLFVYTQLDYISQTPLQLGSGSVAQSQQRTLDEVNMHHIKTSTVYL